MKKITSLIVIMSAFFASCEADSTANVSSITNYALIELNGNNPMFVQQGTTYSDPGVTATENGTPIEATISGFGNYRGTTSIDTNKSDHYSQTYTATNKDGFKASTSRNVYVYKNGDLVNSIEGIYTSTVRRNGSSAAQYTNMKYVLIWKNTDGKYQISDGIGGYYNLGRGYGFGYIAGPVTITANDIPGNNFTVSPFIVNGFGGAATMTAFTVDPITKKITFSTSWSTYTFEVTLTQVQP